MHYIPQLIFLIVLGIANYGIFKSIKRIKFNINLGRPEKRNDQKLKRFKIMTLMALGQKKMFKKPLPAIFHFLIYLGFIIVNLEVLEIVLDGIFGTHRIFAPYISNIYPLFINIFEFFAVAVIIACIVFLSRRNLLNINRFQGEEMKKWPKIDANTILIVEVFLMIAFLVMNTVDLVLQSRGYGHYSNTGIFFISGNLMQVFNSFSSENLVFVERFCWWFHIIGILCFANYVFWDSKHLHIFMAFPNTYFSKLEAPGKWPNMPAVTKEVKLMLNLPLEEADQLPDNEKVKFGAKDVQDLTWKNLFDAYSCTECGRCTQQCPANITGKKLSPRKIMMDTRDRMELVGKNIALHGPEFSDGKNLLEDYITSEEIFACTTCNACVEACPVNINPLDIIVQLRQYKIMEASQAPGSWNGMFSNIENNSAPWKFPSADRFNWADNLNSEQK